MNYNDIIMNYNINNYYISKRNSSKLISCDKLIHYKFYNDFIYRIILFFKSLVT